MVLTRALPALRTALFGLLPMVAAACWMERPNLASTGGGYTAGGASRPAGAHESAADGASAGGEAPDAAPAGH